MNEQQTEDNLIHALKMRYSLDTLKAKKVIEYAKTLAEVDLPEKIMNDYAVAKALNDTLYAILQTVYSAQKTHARDAAIISIQPLNRAYILLTRELKNLYSWNVQLQELSPEPIWTWLDILEGREWELVEEDGLGNSTDLNARHIAQLNKLNIIEGTQEPVFDPSIKQLIEESQEAITQYSDAIQERISKRISNHESSRFSRTWQIPEYTLTYTDNGSLVVNGVLTLKKTQSGSAPRMLMEQAIDKPNQLFKPFLGENYTRRLSSVLSDMKISGTLKQLFFPVVSDKDGIKFRPTVSLSTAESEQIDTYDLDTQLSKKNAKTEEKPIDLSQIPF